jgi:hypothetical protein
MEHHTTIEDRAQMINEGFKATASEADITESTAPRRWAVACRSSRSYVALRKSACISANSTSPTIFRPLPVRRRPSASGAVKRSGVIVGSARLYVCSHRTKRLIVAIKYEAEKTYR